MWGPRQQAAATNSRAREDKGKRQTEQTNHAPESLALLLLNCLVLSHSLCAKTKSEWSKAPATRCRAILGFRNFRELLSFQWHRQALTARLHIEIISYHPKCGSHNISRYHPVLQVRISPWVDLSPSSPRRTPRSLSSLEAFSWQSL